MRILLIADLHGDDAVVDRLRAIAGKYDMVIVAGDLGPDKYIKNLLSISDNIYWVPGNMERPESCEWEKCIHKKRIELEDGLNLVGFGFSGPTPFGTPGELSEEEIYAQMNALPIDKKTILVTHTPPYGVLDDVGGGVHAGSKSLRKIMEEKEPRVLACGHIHHVEGREKAGETTVVQIPEGRMLRGVLLVIEQDQVMIHMESL
ncbi:hypothetical protein GF412_02955 [Candidatus Micrarchaeota archaeon]|nr:hypothetical protein [Candidatus Micrarchaeota archaeon]MBD3417911.1 hypothetical protein [Candidatus Micrarchaeota archaeon]